MIGVVMCGTNITLIIHYAKKSRFFNDFLTVAPKRAHGTTGAESRCGKPTKLPIMKKHHSILLATRLLLAGSLLTGACTRDEGAGEGEGGTLEVTPSSLGEIAPGGAVVQFNVTCNSYWHVAVEDEDGLPLGWVSTDIERGMGDAEINLTAKVNIKTQPRSGRLVFELDGMGRRVEIPFTQEGNTGGGGGGEEVYAITPITDFFLCDPTTASGGEFRVYTCALDTDTETVTFHQTGNTVRRIGGTADKSCRLFGKSNIYNGRFTTTGWGGEDWDKSALIVRMKATSELKGRLRFGFGFVSADAVPKNWKCAWSADGQTWHEEVEVAATPYTTFTSTFELKSTSPYKMARFALPAGETIPKGGSIHIKIQPTDNSPIKGSAVLSTGTVTFNHGFYLTTDQKRAYHTRPMPAGDEVVFAHGFDEAFQGHDYFIPARYFFSNYNNLYNEVMPAGWSASETGVRECPGYVYFGGNSNKGSGWLMTPPLEKLGDTQTDITVTFDLAFFASAAYKEETKSMAVSVEGPGTVGAQPDYSDIPSIKGETIAEMEATDETYFRWYEGYEVKIAGATRDTRIRFATDNGRHFLDNIIVTKD